MSCIASASPPFPPPLPPPLPSDFLFWSDDTDPITTIPLPLSYQNEPVLHPLEMHRLFDHDQK